MSGFPFDSVKPLFADEDDSLAAAAAAVLGAPFELLPFFNVKGRLVTSVGGGITIGGLGTGGVMVTPVIRPGAVDANTGCDEYG